MFIPIFSPLLADPAYLDPGSGSFILQVLLASLVGIGFAFRGFWARLLGRGKSASEDDDDEPVDGE
ncbi:MAG: hypothetical protein HYZ26_05495 [Chloroflexi bacterium]|nr:hypothetical protein [Chloroflexota bacterium]